MMQNFEHFATELICRCAREKGQCKLKATGATAKWETKENNCTLLHAHSAY